MADETIDSLQIEITSSSSEAQKSLNGLISSIKKLDKIGKAAGLVEVKKQLRGIAAIHFDNISGQLKDVTAYVEQLQRASKRLGEISVKPPTVDTTEVVENLNEMVDEVRQTREEVQNVGESFSDTVEVKRPEWLGGMQSECKAISESLTVSATKLATARTNLTTALDSKRKQFSADKTFVSGSNLADSLQDKMVRLQLQAEILSEKLDSMVENDNVDLTSWDQLQKQLLSVRLQYQALEQQVTKNATAVNHLGEESKKAQGKFGRLIARMKNILLYRTIRFLLSQIANGAREGLENIAKFSSEANSIMSSYKSEFTYMKNSIGSALIPMLKSVLPIVIRIGDAFVDITNSIGMLSAAINGDKTFVKAKKYAQNYVDTLNEVKRSVTGFDELNILGKQDTTNEDVSQMFEEVDISGWDIAGSAAKIAAIVASVTGLIMLIKGVKVGDFFGKIGKGIANAWKYLKNVTGWKKAGLAIAAIGTEVVTVYNGFYDLAKGTRSAGSVLLELIPITVVVGAAMTAMFGPVGIVITLLAAVVSAIGGVRKAQRELKHEQDMAEFFKSAGVEISTVNDLLDGYFRSLNIDKQAEWNEKLAEASDNLIDAARNYDELWYSIKGCETIDSNDIEKLASAFNDLADAAVALNEAAIQSVMASIRTGIEMNITPELTAKLDGLLASLQTAQDLLNVKVSGLTAEYQQLLNEIQAQGGTPTSEQRERLEQLRSDINKFTLTDKTSSTEWALSLEQVLQQGINAGDNEEAVKQAVSDLTENRKAYLETLRQNQASSLSTLEQLWEKDRDLFGGQLGFYKGESSFEQSEVYATLMENYNAQVAEVQKKYNEVLQAIIDSFAAKALDYDEYWADVGILDGLAWLGGWITGLFGDDFLADRDTAKEQKEFIEWLQSLLSNGYATGGMPESGEIFAARENGIPELVGTVGRHAAVANNADIIEGIKQGVIEAMQESGGGQGGDWTIQIVDDGGRVRGEAIITAAERKNRRDGKTIITVGG